MWGLKVFWYSGIDAAPRVVPSHRLSRRSTGFTHSVPSPNKLINWSRDLHRLPQLKSQDRSPRAAPSGLGISLDKVP